jgi:hypothetical protein
MSRSLLLVAALVVTAAAVAFAALPTPGPTVTDATLIARLGRPLTPADHLALAVYYRAKAKEADARVEFADRLYRTYLKLEGKPFIPVQEQARKLLRGARELRKRFEMLAAAHHTLALEQLDDDGSVFTPVPVTPATRTPER